MEASQLQRRTRERLKIAPVVAQQFRSLVEDYGSLHGLRVGPHNESLWKIPAVMSIDKAEAILQSHKKALLPKLSLIPQAPVLVVNSQGEPEVLTSGYHPECGGLYIRSRAKLQQEMPYSEAVNLILFLLEDFSFVSPSDKSRAFAAIIAPALRIGRILNCHFPLFAVEADESQAGKGFLLELIHSVYNERVALVLNRKGGVGSLDEEISRVLLAGKPFIQLDNIRDLISSEFFEGIMTCEFGSTVAARVPYRGRARSTPISTSSSSPPTAPSSRLTWLIARSSSGFSSAKTTHSRNSRKGICSTTSKPIRPLPLRSVHRSDALDRKGPPPN